MANIRNLEEKIHLKAKFEKQICDALNAETFANFEDCQRHLAFELMTTVMKLNTNWLFSGQIPEVVLPLHGGMNEKTFSQTCVCDKLLMHLAHVMSNFRKAGISFIRQPTLDMCYTDRVTQMAESGPPGYKNKDSFEPRMKVIKQEFNYNEQGDVYAMTADVLKCMNGVEDGKNMFLEDHTRIRVSSFQKIDNAVQCCRQATEVLSALLYVVKFHYFCEKEAHGGQPRTKDIKINNDNLSPELAQDKFVYWPLELNEIQVMEFCSDYKNLDSLFQCEYPLECCESELADDSKRCGTVLNKITNTCLPLLTTLFGGTSIEYRISVRGLCTSQAVIYMRTLKCSMMQDTPVQLLAEWNLNQNINDDYKKSVPIKLNSSIEIALKAVELTALCGFDGLVLSDTDNVCKSNRFVLSSLEFDEALTVVHEAHSSGLKINYACKPTNVSMKYAALVSVDGLENFPEVNAQAKDKSGNHENEMTFHQTVNGFSRCTRARGAGVLANLDELFSSGKLTEDQKPLRVNLYHALLAMDIHKIERILQETRNVSRPL